MNLLIVQEDLLIVREDLLIVQEDLLIVQGLCSIHIYWKVHFSKCWWADLEEEDQAVVWFWVPAKLPALTSFHEWNKSCEQIDLATNELVENQANIVTVQALIPMTPQLW